MGQSVERDSNLENLKEEDEREKKMEEKMKKMIIRSGMHHMDLKKRIIWSFYI